MAFSLAAELPLREALRTAALDEAAQTREALIRGGVRGVHEARKGCKRLRAWVRLLRPWLPQHGHRLDALLRDSGHSLGPLRDADVARQLLSQWRKRQQLDADSIAALRRTLPRAPPRRPVLLRAQTLLDAAAVELNTCRPPDELKDVRKRLERGWRRCARDFHRLAHNPQRHAEDLHAWRKRIKRLQIQVQLLAPRGLPDTLADSERGLDALGDTLGKHHDWAQLEQRVAALNAASGGSGGDDARALAVHRLRKLETRALAQGAELFA